MLCVFMSVQLEPAFDHNDLHKSGFCIFVISTSLFINAVNYKYCLSTGLLL